MKRLRLLVDANNLFHRLRHVHKELRSDKGRPTGVCYGTLNMVTNLITDFDPDEIIFCHDPSITMKQSWRYSVYAGYKSARKVKHKALPLQERLLLDEFYEMQIPDCMNMLAGFGIPQFQLPELEADDLVAALSHRIRQDKGTECIIISTDKDMLQLVRRFSCRVFNPHTKAVYYQDKFGNLKLTGPAIPIAPSPKFFLFRRSVAGDASDSIPGVPGVGEVTAEKLINGTVEFKGSVIDYIEQNAGTLRESKAGQKILDHVKEVALSYRLMKLGVPPVERLKDVHTLNFVSAIKSAYASTYREYAYPFDHYGVFLSQKALTFGSAYQRFFVRRGFDFINKPNIAAGVVAAFRRLRRLREDMYQSLENANG